MTDNLRDLPVSRTLKDKWLLSWDETQQKFARVSPKMLTSTIYTEDGTPLDELLKVTPSELAKMVEDILAGAPEAYNTFLEVSQALEGNKDSISEIFREISKRVVRPDGGKTGQVLKLNSDGQVVFADDDDTIYTHPETHKAGIIETDQSHRFVTDKEKETWDKKLDEKSDLGKNMVTVKVPKWQRGKIVGETEESLPLAYWLETQERIMTEQGLKENKANGYPTLDENAKIKLNQLQMRL